MFRILERSDGFPPETENTAPEWQFFLDEFRLTLDKFKVPPTEQAELCAIVESTGPDIVVPRR
jgi:hypothetical protein